MCLAMQQNAHTAKNQNIDGVYRLDRYISGLFFVFILYGVEILIIYLICDNTSTFTFLVIGYNIKKPYVDPGIIIYAYNTEHIHISYPRRKTVYIFL